MKKKSLSPRVLRVRKRIGLLLSLLTGCGPSHPTHEERSASYVVNGPTEYRIFRRDRVLEQVFTDDAGIEVRQCGTLDESVYMQLLESENSLDPDAEYPGPGSCETFPKAAGLEASFSDDAGSLYLANFSSAPFDCWWYCCAEELTPIGRIYYYAHVTLLGSDPTGAFQDPLGAPFDVFVGPAENCEP